MDGKHVCRPEPREAMWSGVVDKNASMNTLGLICKAQNF